MTDPRLSLFNARVAAASETDAPAHLARVEGTPKQVSLPILDLRREPKGSRDRQLLFGDDVLVLEDRRGWSFVQTAKDGYVGYVPSDGLRACSAPTHWVSAPATHVYGRPDFKSPDQMSLSFGSRITALGQVEGHVETMDGFIPSQHLSPLEHRPADPVGVAPLFLGTPYLWGGNSRWGIDCSGLVQAAFLACGLPCPGDSDQQERIIGQSLPLGSDPLRGDLLFWKGHVALVVDPKTIIHANAYHMATAYEPLDEAIRRIEKQGDGGIRAHRRP